MLPILSLLLSACAAATDTSTTATVDTTSATTSAVTTGPVANDLVAFDRMEIVVAGEPFAVAVADTPVLRAQGLMGVTDLGGLDGMLFVFDDATDTSFWMKDTLIPLDIWFFDAAGRLVSMTTMVPCEADPCERYPATGSFRYALETEVGRVGLDQTVELDF